LGGSGVGAVFDAEALVAGGARLFARPGKVGHRLVIFTGVSAWPNDGETEKTGEQRGFLATDDEPGEFVSPLSVSLFTSAKAGPVQAAIINTAAKLDLG
jgi:hypothetical protein